MDAIPAIRRTAAERVDGTLVVKFEIEPRYKADFQRLFPNMDMAAAIAPLAVGVALPEPEPAKPKVSHENSRSVAIICKQHRFWKFLSLFNQVVESEDEANAVVKETCGVESKSEFDTNKTAMEAWEREFLTPYRSYVNG